MKKVNTVITIIIITIMSGITFSVSNSVTVLSSPQWTFSIEKHLHNTCSLWNGVNYFFSSTLKVTMEKKIVASWPEVQGSKCTHLSFCWHVDGEIYTETGDYTN